MSQHAHPHPPGPTPYRSSAAVPDRPATLTRGFVGALLAGLFGALGVAAMLLGVVVVVLLFLPPTNRYATARKLHTGAR